MIASRGSLIDWARRCQQQNHNNINYKFPAIYLFPHISISGFQGKDDRSFQLKKLKRFADLSAKRLAAVVEVSAWRSCCTWECMRHKKSAYDGPAGLPSSIKNDCRNSASAAWSIPCRIMESWRKLSLLILILSIISTTLLLIGFPKRGNSI